jgi:Na+-translocating ferredoxin:NAD+ oxidoreductase subunit G
MGNIFKLAAILFLVGGIAAGSLAFFNSFTKPAIEKLKAETETKAREYVLNGLVPEDKISSVVYEKDSLEIQKGSYEFFYKVKENESAQNHIAYIFLAKGSGFSGVIETMVCTDTQFKINRIKVLKHTETPGLGAEAQTIKYGDKEPFFEGWFKEKNSLKVVVEKDDSSSPDKIQSLTGATITTRAICKSIVSYSELLKKYIEQQVPVIYVGDAESVVSYDHEKVMAQIDSIRNAEAKAAKGGK